MTIDSNTWCDAPFGIHLETLPSEEKGQIVVRNNLFVRVGELVRLDEDPTAQVEALSKRFDVPVEAGVRALAELQERGLVTAEHQVTEPGEEIVKRLHQVAEDHRVALRNIRRDANEHLKKLMKDKTISEDEERRALDEMQKMTDGYIGKIDAVSKGKEKEILDFK